LPPNARIIHATKPGSYAARNTAIAEAQGEVLFFTDSDCLPDPRWIEAGLAAIAPLSPFDLVAGGVDLFPAGKHWTAIELYDWKFQMRQERFAKKGWCVTANLVARREAFDHYGMFNGDRFSGGDKEWTAQATARGSRLVYRKDVLIRHPARADFAEVAKKRRRIIGGSHQAQVLGQVPRRKLRSYLRVLSKKDIAVIRRDPGLTDWQRAQILWIRFRLGMISFFEMLRLRHLNGTPRRS
jgi:glycosyltransferase involved in cell wall biosynthesis